MRTMTSDLGRSGRSASLRLPRAVPGVAMLLALATACHPEVEQDLGLREVAVATWWDDGEAYAEPKDSLRLELANEITVEYAEPETDAKRDFMAHLAEQIDSGEGLPDAFLGDAGRDIMRWAPCGIDAGDGERLVALGDPDSSSWYHDTFPEWMVDSLRCDGSGPAYGMPVVVHRVNTIYYHPESFGADVDWAQLTLADFTRRMRAFPQPRLGLPPGDTELVSFFADGLMVAVLGPDDYEAFWNFDRGASDVLWGKVDEAIEAFSQLADCLNVLDEDPIEAVRTGSVAALATGNWLVHDERDPQVALAAFPEMWDVHVLTVEAFAVPMQASVSSGLAFIQAVSDAEVQAVIARQKPGAAPARVDVDEDEDSVPEGVRTVPALPALLGGAGAFAGLADHLSAIVEDEPADRESSQSALLDYLRCERSRRVRGGAPSTDCGAVR